MSEYDITPEYRAAQKILGANPLIYDHPSLMTDEEQQARFDQMWLLYNTHGWSLKQVGNAFGEMSKESVRQIFHRFGRLARPQPGSGEFRRQRRAKRDAQAAQTAATSG